MMNLPGRFFKMVAIMLLIATFAEAKSVKVEDLVLEPAVAQTVIDQEYEFTVRGGTPPYIFKTSAGMIRYKDNTATFIAPSFPGPSTVSVQDSNGLSKSIVIHVVAE